MSRVKSEQKLNFFKWVWLIVSSKSFLEMRLRVDKLVENFKKRKHEYEASKDPRVEYRQKRRKIYFEMLEREKVKILQSRE